MIAFYRLMRSQGALRYALEASGSEPVRSADEAAPRTCNGAHGSPATHPQGSATDHRTMRPAAAHGMRTRQRPKRHRAHPKNAARNRCVPQRSEERTELPWTTTLSDLALAAERKVAVPRQRAAQYKALWRIGTFP